MRRCTTCGGGSADARPRKPSTIIPKVLLSQHCRENRPGSTTSEETGIPRPATARMNSPTVSATEQKTRLHHFSIRREVFGRAHYVAAQFSSGKHRQNHPHAPAPNAFGGLPPLCRRHSCSRVRALAYF